MREYVLTELRPEETAALEELLTAEGCKASIDHLYWLTLPPEVCSPLQREHRDCAPHSAAVDVSEESVRMELLIRARNRLRCSCIAWADETQTAWLIRRLHELLAEAGVEA